MLPRRIAVVGISGSGKSSFARALSASSGLPLHHMDRLFWRGRWEAVPEADYIAAQQALLADDAWIIEGYIDPALAERARAADLILYLDFSGARCAWRVLKRWWRHRRVARPELPPEAVERLDPRFLWVALSRAERPAIEAALAGVDPARVRRVRTPAELRGLPPTFSDGG
jgi:adenylate kinase family enzyme